jgi:hypothetical protein
MKKARLILDLSQESTQHPCGAHNGMCKATLQPPIWTMFLPSTIKILPSGGVPTLY